MRARLRQPPHEVLVRVLFEPGLRADRANFGNAMRVNSVHAILLVEAGVLDPANAAALLKLYRDMDADGLSALQLDASLEDLHFNIEAHVIRVLGPDVGGRMHTGRSRNDLNATTARMWSRERTLTLARRLADLRTVLLSQAVAYSDTTMTGYTHLQPAQPITLGFYLLGVEQALARDFRRLQLAYEMTDQCPLGAGALAGSGYALNRALGAKLLGFSGLVRNALDAVASRDYMVDVLAAGADLAVNISRVSQDLQMWGSDEFSTLEFADEVCIVSSVMPQKKNAISLEHCKGKAGHVVGHLVAALVAAHSAPFSNSRDVNREVPAALAAGLDQVEALVELIGVTIGSMRARPEVMLAAARDNFSAVTELADLLVRSHGVPFRSAHEIVAKVVTDAIARGEKSSAITATVVRRSAKEVLGMDLDVADRDVINALDPEFVIANRKTEGGASAGEIKRMTEVGQTSVDAGTAWIEATERQLREADSQLASVAETLVAA